MNVKIGTDATQILFREYINGDFVAVCRPKGVGCGTTLSLAWLVRKRVQERLCNVQCAMCIVIQYYSSTDLESTLSVNEMGLELAGCPDAKFLDVIGIKVLKVIYS